MTDPPFVEPRRECQQVVAVYQNGGHRVCGAHVRETDAPSVVWCDVCARHSRYRDTKETS